MTYTYKAGTGGVDETFDIYNGKEYVASVYFWEMRKEAEAAAKAICELLTAWGPSIDEEAA